MEFETYVRLINEFGDLKHLHLQGLGEPLMHPRFFDMVTYAHNRGALVTTNTNLTLLNDRKARLCVTSGLDIVHVSLDAATSDVYESIRVRSHFDRVLANIERLQAAKVALGSQLPEIRLVMVLMRRNLPELPGMVRLASQLGIGELSVQHLCHDFTEDSLPAKYAPIRSFVSEETLMADPDLPIAETYDEAGVLAQKLGVDLRLPSLDRRHEPRSPTGCDWPTTGAYVSYDGYSMPCCMISTPDRANFGRLAERSMTQIWNDDEYEAFRAGLANGTPPDVCAACSVYKGTF